MYVYRSVFFGGVNLNQVFILTLCFINAFLEKTPSSLKLSKKYAEQVFRKKSKNHILAQNQWSRMEKKNNYESEYQTKF